MYFLTHVVLTFTPSTGIPSRCHGLKSGVQGSLGGSGFPGGHDTKASTPNIKPAENDSNVEADFLKKRAQPDSVPEGLIRVYVCAMWDSASRLTFFFQPTPLEGFQRGDLKMQENTNFFVEKTAKTTQIVTKWSFMGRNGTSTIPK